MMDVIKEYLVSLGFSVDAASLGKAENSVSKFAGSSTSALGKVSDAMEDTKKDIIKFAEGSVKYFKIATVAVGSFVFAANAGIATFLNSLAKADLENAKFAMQMWTTKENATAVKNSLNAMGASMEDLYLSPELAKNFQQLRSETANLKAPDEFMEQLKFIRSIKFELQRMKLEATYALQWVGYYFIKYMEGPLQNIKQGLQNINEVIVKTMPQWTKVIAQVMTWFARMGITLVRASQDIGKALSGVLDKIPEKFKLIGGGLVALALMIKTGPLGVLMGLFTAAIVLLDDFYTYLDGGESALAPFWKKLIDLYSELKNSEAFKKFKENISLIIEYAEKFIDKVEKLYSKLKENGSIEKFKDNIMDVLNLVLKIVADIPQKLEDFYKKLEDNGAIDNFKETIQTLKDMLKDIFDPATGGLANLYKELDKNDSFANFILNISKLTKGISDLASGIVDLMSKLVDSKFIAGFLDSISTTIGSVGDFASSLGKLLKGDVDGSYDSLMKSLSSTWGLIQKNSFNNPSNMPDVDKYLYPQSTSSTNIKNTLSPTFNVYGSPNPVTTAKVVQRQNEDFMIRNLQGVFK